jgi:hypothetical protein
VRILPIIYSIKRYAIDACRVYKLSNRITFGEAADRQLHGNEFLKGRVRTRLSMNMIAEPALFPDPKKLSKIEVASIEEFASDGRFLPRPTKVKVVFQYPAQTDGVLVTMGYTIKLL